MFNKVRPTIYYIYPCLIILFHTTANWGRVENGVGQFFERGPLSIDTLETADKFTVFVCKLISNIACIILCSDCFCSIPV